MTRAQREPAALRLEKVTKIFPGVDEITAVRDVSLTLPVGSFTSIMGPSGSGKSTLLLCAAGLEQPTRGDVWIGGAALPHGSEAALTKFRRSRVGFVFQSYNLLPYLTAAQNIDLPRRFAGGRVDPRWQAEVIERLELTAFADRPAAQLSGGQQQRVAVARALACRPTVLFADEPTGALDTANARVVLALLREAADAFGQTVVLVTHDPNAAASADSVVLLADGSIRDQLTAPTATQVAERMSRLAATRNAAQPAGRR